jgi:hypothetical protein
MKIKQFINLVFEYLTNLIKNLSPKEKEDILRDLDAHVALIKNNMQNNETKQQALLRLAKDNLGRDITPNDKIPDNVACAEGVSTLIKTIYPDFPIIPSTLELDNYLRKDKRFEPTLDLDAGNIIISPTGRGNGLIAGHCGVLLEGGKIASNNSYTGLLDNLFTIELWVKRYRVKGGFPIYVFKPLN